MATAWCSLSASQSWAVEPCTRILCSQHRLCCPHQAEPVQRRRWGSTAAAAAAVIVASAACAGPSRRRRGRWNTFLTVRSAESEGVQVEQPAGVGENRRPVVFKSVPGQKVAYLMEENPALFDWAFESELEVLSEARATEEEEAAQRDWKRSSSSSSSGKPKGASDADDIKFDFGALRAQVAALRETERHRAVTELMYLAVCNKFDSLKIPQVQPMAAGGAVPVEVGARNISASLSSFHSQEAQAVIETHIATSIPMNPGVMQMPLLSIGQAYATTALFGYVLRRAEGRLSLELATGSREQSDAPGRTLAEYLASYGPGQFQDLMVTSEAQFATELQVVALFGDLNVLKGNLFEEIKSLHEAEIGSAAQNDNEMAQSLLNAALERGAIPTLALAAADLRRLLMEAITFGALMHDMERDMQGLCELTPSVPGGNLTAYGVETDHRGFPAWDFYD